MMYMYNNLQTKMFRLILVIIIMNSIYIVRFHSKTECSKRFKQFNITVRSNPVTGMCGPGPDVKSGQHSPIKIITPITITSVID